MICPGKIHSILLRILSIGLLRIRAGHDRADQIQAEADHLPNLPDLIENFEHEKLLFYWEVERPAFSRSFPNDHPASFEEC